MSLKVIRHKKGLTQTELDDAAGITRGTTSDIERGKNAHPSWEIVSRISEALNVKPEKLFPVNKESAA